MGANNTPLGRVVPQPAYKQRARMRERSAFVAAVQARTLRSATVWYCFGAEFGAVGNHGASVPPECGVASPCDVGGTTPAVVANVSGAAA